jgi:hypothetical protein
MITEFLADNVTGIEDEDGNREDWIEIFNAGETPVNLAGWRLTDNPANLAKWVFPSVTVAPKAYLLVWASEKNRTGAHLHTNFKLSAAGEYLALVRPEGTVAQEFAPAYPPQAPDVAYGLSVTEQEEVLVEHGSPARLRVPTDAAEAGIWHQPAFDDSAWTPVQLGLGFDRAPAPVGLSGLYANSVAEFSSTQGLHNWYYGLYQRLLDADGVYDPDDFTLTYQPVPGDATVRAWTFAGGIWDVIPGNGPWSALTSTGGHPNGTNQANGRYQAVVRRWISEFTGTARVTGRMAHPSASGDGVVCRIFVEGVPVHVRTVYNTTIEYTVSFPVVAGQRVDFYADPGAAEQDANDGFTFTARITGDALADSVADWSEVGTQGLRGWSYGFWNQTADGDGIFAPEEFTPFPRNTPEGNTVSATNAWDGGRWRSAAAPLVEVTQNGGKPQVTGGTTWAIRRWTSTRAGPVRLMGVIGHQGGGDGITGRLLVDGVELTSRAVTNLTVGYSVVAQLAIGTRVDLVLDPNADETGDADALFTCNIAVAAPGTEIVADSSAQWASGVQDAQGWSYGYYNRSADGDGEYAPEDTVFTDPQWTLSAGGWLLGPGDPPWTRVGQETAHPNGTNNGDEHWAVKRWTSTVAGMASLDWQVSKQASGGNGVTLRVFHNGREVDSAALVGTDRLGVTRTTVLAGLQLGDVIDLALSPVGVTGDGGDGNDGSTFSARVLRTTQKDNFARDLIADSQADWSTTGTQGERGWYAGYANRSADPGGLYEPQDFTPFPRDGGSHSASNFWTGTSWDWFAGNPPWTELTSLYAHPNGTNNGAEHWVVRRWTASEDGTFDVEWMVRKSNGSGGGVTLKVFHNGVEWDTAALAGNHTTGISRTVRIPGVTAGDAIDICLTPVGLAGGTDDGSDGSHFWAKIYRLREFTEAIHAGGDLGEAMHGQNATAYVRIPFVFTNSLDRLVLDLDFDDGFVAYLNGQEIARRQAPVEQAGGRLADSRSEFGGIQGVNNWFYGYHNASVDVSANGRYDAEDFLAFPNDGGPWSPANYYSGTLWDWYNTNPPWTSIGASTWHPNGTNNGHAHWAIRRWVAESSGTLHAYVFHAKAAAGNGTTARFFHNGREIWTSTVNSQPGNQAFLALPDVVAGDFLDLALDPLGLTGGTDDGNDTSSLGFFIGQFAAGGLAWNSAATQARAATEVGQPLTLDLSSYAHWLVPGENVLALHGLNHGKDDPDFLLAPRLAARRVEIDAQTVAYHLSPTPGGHNGTGSTTIGPILANPGRVPSGPVLPEDALTITVDLSRSVQDIQSARLYYRVMFGAEVLLPLTPVTPPGPDGAGTYQATVPAGLAAANQMLRWRIEAEDVLGNVMKHPPYPDPLNSPQYDGVVITDTNLVTQLPVFHTFLASPSGADTRAGTRLSFGYGDQFFDNVFINLHGQSSAGFPKKSYNVKLNTGHKLLWHPDAPRINSFNLLTTYPDKANLRNLLAMGVWRDAGAAHHAAFAAQMRRNGDFHSVTHFMEDGDADFLQRLGLGDRNALYKMYNSLENANLAVNNANGAEKKSREWEGFADLQALVAGVAQTGTAEERFLYDHAGIPETVNYLAALMIVGNTDTGHKNYYMFRDSEGNREWFPTPWDVDLSFGRVWSAEPTYYDDTLYTNTSLFVSSGNRFTGPFLDNSQPALRQMFLRRLRTLADTLLQSGSVPVTNRYFETQIDALAALMAPDTTIDYSLWPTWGSNQTQAVAVQLLKEYLNGRRNYVFNHPSLPPAQDPAVGIDFGPLDFNPVSGNPHEEYLTLVNTNAVAVDVSGWRVDGGVRLTLKPGTVIPAGGTLHLARDVNAFRARAASPRANESRFVQGNYDGQLSARGETLELWDGARLVASFSYAGAPSPAQQGLRITELAYNPGALPGDAFADRQMYEFIEFMNISTQNLSLAGVQFTNGVTFAFADRDLAPGERVVVVKDLSAFLARHTDVATHQIAGVFGGNLANSGERLTVVDAFGEEIQDFTFSDLWHPLTDGQGFSLTTGDEYQDLALWASAAGWKPSGTLAGTPARADAEGDTDGDGLPDLYESLRGFSPTNPADGALDSDLDGLSNAQEYRAGTDPWSAASVLALAQEEWNALTGEFRGRFSAVAGRTYTVQRGDSATFATWTRVLDHTAAADAEIEFVDTPPPGSGRAYYRVVTPQAP